MTAPQMTGAPWTTSPGAIVFLPEPTQGFTEAEAYAFLMGGAPAPEVIVAAADVQDGAMIALIPSSSDLSRLAVPDGEPIEQLHVTMFILGLADDIDEETQRTIIDAMKDLAQRLPVVDADVFSFSVFSPGDPGACLVAGLTGSDLEDAHDSVEEFLGETGFDIPDQHEPWIPHCTLIYDTDPEKYLTHELMLQAGPITLDKIRVAFGGVVTDIPLGAAVVAALDEPFHLAGKHNQQSHAHGSAPLEQVSGRQLKKQRKSYDEKIGGASTGFAGGHDSVDSGDADVQDAMSHYAGSVGYYDINTGLREAHGNVDEVVIPPRRNITGNPSPYEDNEELRTDISTLHRGMEESHTPHDIVAHRVVSNPDVALGSHYRQDGDNSGLTWREHGFTSTTTGGKDYIDDQKIRLRGGIDNRQTPTMTMRILIPAGSHALAGRREEAEVVLDSGSVFRIIHDHGIDPAWNTHNVDVELIS